MLIVHHLNNSRSQRVLGLLEELEVPYEIVRYQRGSDMQAPKELRAIHPLGKSPVIPRRWHCWRGFRHGRPTSARSNAADHMHSRTTNSV